MTAEYRWTPMRKAQVIDQVESGNLSIDAACALYGMSEDELAEWRRRYVDGGVRGLSALRQPRREKR